MAHIPPIFEEWLFRKLLYSRGFQSFVRTVYCKINGIKPRAPQSIVNSGLPFHPTRGQKFRAFRVLFWDEVKVVFGATRTFKKSGKQ
ncbi:ABL169Wp [Eremothecium gossypii ATCC 10895]|uniref:ABL169Wp n=1 Tax=Eremothecium gossypii (strain ATCC 10895 / CBS 109.51 / FGSC 9923 / NRRL Y-1056) TaxID=284811 RepID=Q75E39_EREGS|nr:ABL169Wp [Eremothecium gossypii ATCC 10895]AAS50602.1 ABL169Wp [Eremothecium gossypii ATCC 10895]AEY94890.1 FABL169Wp [Eremothecium gossypii FDAG1]